MTTQRDFKRLVRGRMQKTGESYTAARAWPGAPLSSGCAMPDTPDRWAPSCAPRIVCAPECRPTVSQVRPQ